MDMANVSSIPVAFVECQCDACEQDMRHSKCIGPEAV